MKTITAVAIAQCAALAAFITVTGIPPLYWAAAACCMVLLIAASASAASLVLDITRLCRDRAGSRRPGR